VVIGDLNGADDVLEDLLRGTGLVHRRGRWVGVRAELVQLGDVFNRGGAARAAFERLLALRPQAAQAGGRVTVLLGNHEMRVALRNEAYCTAEEYPSFATAKERREWPVRVERHMLRLFRDHRRRGPILPFEARLEAWKVLNVPGRAAFRRAVSAQGRLGKRIRRLPVAHQIGDVVFVHAGLQPQWARLGIAGLNARVRAEWLAAKTFIRSLRRSSLLADQSGPLWDRRYAHAEPGTAAQLSSALRELDARRMVVGHTATHSVRGGQLGRIHPRFRGRLVLADCPAGGLQGGLRPCSAVPCVSGGSWR
jgi:hypothetical protein